MKTRILTYINKESFNESIRSYQTEIDRLDNYFVLLNALILKQDSKEKTLEANGEKVNDLNKPKGILKTLKENIEASNLKVQEINNSLGSYSSDLSKLKIKKQAEDEYNILVDKIIRIYPSFYADLNAFKEREFQLQFGTIENEIAGFYRQINKHDPFMRLWNYLK